jgi:hypothetical protein
MLDAPRCGFVGLALLGACLAGTASAGDAPAGIVMAMTGSTDPPLSTMTEIPADAPIRLATGSRLTFLHYARCKLVTVDGGQFRLSQPDYKVDGHIEAEDDGPCPQTYSVKPPGSGTGSPATAGVIMRGAPGVPHWPVDAQLRVTGSRAHEFAKATVAAEDAPGIQAAAFAIADGKAVASPGALPLLPNRRYVLRLIPADGSKSTELVFVATAASQPQPLVILRLD